MQDRNNISITAGLSIEERELLAVLLEEKGIDLQPEPAIAARDHDGNPPLSFSQQRLWFLHQLEPDSSVYNIPIAVRLKGKLKISPFEQTLSEVMRRHESLRTSFPQLDGRPVPVVRLGTSLTFPVIDLSGLQSHEREDTVRRLANEEGRRPFDLCNGPILRSKLVRAGEEDHIVSLTMHHIVSDAWSRSILIRELATLYQTFSEGGPSNLPELPFQYSDFALWQRDWLAGEVLDIQLGYWKKQLADVSILNIPTDKPRPAIQSFRGAQHFFSLPAELTGQLNELSRREGVTLFMTLAAAFKVLLHRYTQQEDIIVGTPIAGRGRAEVEGLIGYFVNTLVLRTNLGGDPSFHELLQRVREVTLAAYAHQDIPFEKLIGELQVERSLSHSPLFQVLLTFQNAPAETLSISDMKVDVFAVEGNSAKFDLTLVLEESGGSLHGTIEYNTDLFEAATIDRLTGHFTQLLIGAIGDPGNRISLLPLLTSAKQREISSKFEAPLPEYGSDQCLHRLFQDEAKRAPDAIAVVCDGQAVSYGDLNRRANQLANYLEHLGVGVETPVAMLMERSIELVIGILGILKAGGTYVPIEPSYPRERLLFMLEDAGVRVLLTQEEFADRVEDISVRAIRLDSDWEIISAASGENLANAVLSENLAYIIYTSGSTGKPKGVMVTHRNVVRLLAASDHWYGFGTDDVWPMFHSYAFDVSVWELWGAFLYGGKLLIVPYWISRTPDVFHELLSKERATVLNQTPSAFRQFMEREEGLPGGAGENGKLRDDTSDMQLALRYVVFAGEALELRSLTPWFARHGDKRPQLINMYGITETTVHSSYRPVCEDDLRTSAGSVVGVAIPDLHLHVLDAGLEIAPIGVPGEIYVGGAGVTAGYLGRAELTAQRFIPDPFSSKSGARLYRSGDLARRLLGDELEYRGRIDNQIKIRGFRVELGEIETALCRHEAVRQAVVIAEGTELKRLIAYLVCEDGKRVTTSEMHSFAHARLPQHMVPAVFMQIEAVPLTTNGKLDRRALPKTGAERLELSTRYQAPRTPAEEILAGIWSEVLDIERIGINDNFFELGGDSIRSVRILAMARQQGLEFSLRQLFSHQTIEELSREISTSERRIEPGAKSKPFCLVSAQELAELPEDIEDAYPLTMLQVGMLYYMELMPDSSVYHNVNSWHLRAEFREEEFREAVQHVVARHPVLRTSFDMTRYMEPLQLVHKSATLPIVVEDLRQNSAIEQEEAVAEFLKREARNRFDTSRPPLLRFRIHRRTDDTFQFSLTECHAILDGWSLTSTLAEIFERYFALLADEKPASEEPLSATFRDFVGLERAALKSPECRRFWEEKLDSCDVLRLPRLPHSGDSALGGACFREMSVPISAELSEGLTRVARLAKTPLKSVLLAAHIKVLGFLSGQADVITGFVTNGRSEEVDGERVRGLFLNTVPFRLSIEPGTWRDLIRRTFEAELELLPYRRYPLVALQRKYGSQPLFEAQFNYVHFHVLEGVLRSGNIEVLDSSGIEEVHFPLEAAFGRDPMTERVYLNLQYDTSVFGDDRAEAIAAYYRRALSDLANDPNARHNDCALLSDNEQRQLLIEWNQTARSYPPGQTLCGLFQAQVQRAPDAIAIVCEDTQLTYSGLDGLANQLANTLAGSGIRSGMRIGVFAERSAEMAAALLAILKTGAAYVPLDPSYPKERLDFMLRDAGIEMLLTQRQLVERLPANGAHLLELDDAWEAIAEQRGRQPITVNHHEESPAYVIYTSGSTGTPKGVTMPHRGICNHLLWRQAAYPLTSNDRFLHKASISFDISVWEIFGTFMSGATLVMARPNGQQDSSYLAHLINLEAVTTAHFAPAMLQAMLQEGEIENCASLRRVFCGGESLSAELEAQFFDRLDTELIHQYGPTEAAVDVTTWPCERGSLPENVPLGRPVANTRLYILDPALQPAPVGTPGELYVGGDSLAHGYLNRPSLSAERFVPNPFSAEPGTRLYRTGDLTRYLPGGAIEFLGRIDYQVKVRGFRIELGEIESVLCCHESVSEAAVIAREDQPGNKRLVAYVVSAEQTTPTASELRRHLQEKLPDYMLPAAFVFLDRLPLSVNGKINRKALPEPDSIRPELEAVYVAPQTDTERVVADIWKHVLQVDEVGVNDNFFDLGGHSLLMLRVHNKLRERFNRDISMVEMFQYPTVRAVARYLGEGHVKQTSLQGSRDRAEARKRAAKRQRHTSELSSRQTNGGSK